MTCGHLLHNMAKIAILPLKAGLILQEELLKIMEKDSYLIDGNKNKTMRLVINSSLRGKSH